MLYAGSLAKFYGNCCNMALIYSIHNSIQNSVNLMANAASEAYLFSLVIEADAE